jgi:hypothetical protein
MTTTDMTETDFAPWPDPTDGDAAAAEDFIDLTAFYAEFLSLACRGDDGLWYLAD